MRKPTRLCALALGCLGTLALAGCTGTPAAGAGGGITVVTTTEIIADLVRQVGGDRVQVTSIVPPGGDPHSYEPVPADAGRIAKADVAFTNHLLLEPQALIKAIDSNLADGAIEVSLAENSQAYGAELIPLVENLALDVIWLGLRVRGDGTGQGADRTSEIELRATGLEGPGDLVMYLTEALGEPVVHFDSGDGLDDSDVISLPPGAHTHVNWAFTRPGIYELTLASRLRIDGAESAEIASGTFRFAVGSGTATDDTSRRLDGGHADLTVDLDRRELYTYLEPGAVGGQAEQIPSGTVIVPDEALITVPEDPRFSFLGEANSKIHQLPQAVIGRHVHGEIDPHLWQDVRNAKAYTQLIRDALVKADPDRKRDYDADTQRFLTQLDDVHDYVGRTVARIAPERRKLVTAHDAFGYLAKAYGLQVAGFVVPNPAQEPSAEQVRALASTIRDLTIPAVFTEPNLLQRSSVLRQVAQDGGVMICQIYGDAFDEQVADYLAMMRHNADELARCLGGQA